MKRISMTLLLSATLITSVARAQSTDTVQHRLLWSTLNDSTMFKYCFGPVAWNSGSNRSFLRMYGSGSMPNGYLRTASFTPSSSDTLCWNRWAQFDDAGYKHNAITPTRAALDSVAADWTSYYSTKEFAPSSTYFSSSSSIKYIIGLYRSSDDVPLWEGDTLMVYVNQYGKLRYKTFPSSFNLWGKVLTPWANTAMYLAARMESNLPTGASLTHVGIQGDSGAYCSKMNLLKAKFQEGTPDEIAPKRTTRSNNLIAPEILSLDVSASKTSIEVNFESRSEGSATVEIVDLLGKILGTREITALRGMNRVPVAISLGQGTYFCSVRSMHNLLTQKIFVEE